MHTEVLQHTCMASLQIRVRVRELTAFFFLVVVVMFRYSIIKDYVTAILKGQVLPKDVFFLKLYKPHEMYNTLPMSILLKNSYSTDKL